MIPVDPTSRLGIYVRSRVLGFDMLGFESVARLWEDCRRWVDEGWDWLRVQQQQQQQQQQDDDNDNENDDDRRAAASSSLRLDSTWPPTAAQLSSHLYDYCTAYCTGRAPRAPHRENTMHAKGGPLQSQQ